MKKSSKYFLIIGGFLLVNFLSVLTINLSLKNNNYNHLKNSSENFKINNQVQKTIFEGEVLTRVEVETLGWSTKAEITLSDWEIQAPNVTQISETSTSGAGVNAAFSDNQILQSIEIPAKITRINFGSFYNTIALTSFTIEANSQLNIIENAAFRLSNISSITLPNTLTHIGGVAFDGSGLTSINIPDSVLSFGYEPFRETASLRNVEMPAHLRGIPPTTPKHGFTQAQWDSIVWRKGKFLGDILTKSVVFGLGWDTKTTITLDDWSTWAPNVTKISETATSGAGVNAAFTENTILQSIEIPAKITQINFGSFYNTTSLTSLTFEANSQLNIIENAAFRLSNISSLTLPNTLTHIGQVAFDGSGLISINIPDSVLSFGYEPFKGTASLINIEMPAHLRGIPPTTPKHGFTQAQWDSIVWRKGKFLGDILTKSVVLGLGWDTKTTITLDDWSTWAPNVTNISGTASSVGTYTAFSDNQILQSIEIPSRITSINYGSFLNATSLTTIIFEQKSSLEIIEDKAFNATSITSITIPDSVKAIGSNSFGGTNLTMPGNQISIPKSFMDPSPEVAKYGFSQTQWENIIWRTIPFLGTILTKLDVENLEWDTKISITLDDWEIWAPNTIELASGTFEEMPFYGNSIIQSIQIPKTIQLINKDAFLDTISLVNIELPFNLTKDQNAFLPRFGFTQEQWNSIIWSDIPKDGLINSIIVKELLRDDSIVRWDEISSYNGILSEAFKDSSVTSIEIKFKNDFIINDNAFVDTRMLNNITMSNFFKENVLKYGFNQQQLENIIWIVDDLSPFSSNFYIIIGVFSALVLIIAISNVIVFIKIKKTND